MKDHYLIRERIECSDIIGPLPPRSSATAPLVIIEKINDDRKEIEMQKQNPPLHAATTGIQYGTVCWVDKNGIYTNREWEFKLQLDRIEAKLAEISGLLAAIKISDHQS